jgi:hypothetical protein
MKVTPDVLAELCHADALTGEGMTEVHPAATEADAATTTHHDCLIVKGIG